MMNRAQVRGGVSPDPAEPLDERSIFMGGMEIGWLARLKNSNERILWLLIGAVVVLLFWNWSLRNQFEALQVRSDSRHAELRREVTEATGNYHDYWATLSREVDALQLRTETDDETAAD